MNSKSGVRLQHYFNPKSVKSERKSVMKNSILCLVFCVFFLTGLQEVKAADPAEVAKVVNLVKTAKSGFLTRDEHEEGSYQLVFVRKGLRYTVFVSSEAHRFMTIWVRPDGTSESNVLEGMTDYQFDGEIDSGNIGEIELGDDIVRKRFESGVSDSGNEAMGEQFKEYWQGKYDKAIVDALKMLR